jgi:hypothetical protein
VPHHASDLPRDELIACAEQALREFGKAATIHFKFTCENCGERVMFSEPNTIFEFGECCRCGHSTPITKGGFTLIATLQP